MKIIVIGAGLFGSIITRALTGEGHEVILIDDQRPYAGSKPSAGLIKPSWLDGFGDTRQGMEILEKLYGLQELPFRTSTIGTTFPVFYLNPRRVLNQHDLIIASVTSVKSSGKVVDVTLKDGSNLVADRVVIACGVWTGELVEKLRGKVRALAGSAFLFQGVVCSNLLHMWRPYHQIKVYQCEVATVWAGDSSAIVQERYNDGMEKASLARVKPIMAKARYSGFLGTRHPLILRGYRPMVKGERLGVCQPVAPHVWVSTGGGKMGSVLAGYHAKIIVEGIQHG